MEGSVFCVCSDKCDQRETVPNLNPVMKLLTPDTQWDVVNVATINWGALVCDRVPRKGNCSLLGSRLQSTRPPLSQSSWHFAGEAYDYDSQRGKAKMCIHVTRLYSCDREHYPHLRVFVCEANEIAWAWAPFKKYRMREIFLGLGFRKQRCRSMVGCRFPSLSFQPQLKSTSKMKTSVFVSGHCLCTLEREYYVKVVLTVMNETQLGSPFLSRKRCSREGVYRFEAFAMALAMKSAINRDCRLTPSLIFWSISTWLETSRICRFCQYLIWPNITSFFLLFSQRMDCRTKSSMPRNETWKLDKSVERRSSSTSSSVVAWRRLSWTLSSTWNHDLRVLRCRLFRYKACAALHFLNWCSSSLEYHNIRHSCKLPKLLSYSVHSSLKLVRGQSVSSLFKVVSDLTDWGQEDGERQEWKTPAECMPPWSETSRPWGAPGDCVRACRTSGRDVFVVFAKGTITCGPSSICSFMLFELATTQHACQQILKGFARPTATVKCQGRNYEEPDLTSSLLFSSRPFLPPSCHSLGPFLHMANKESKVAV